MSARLANPWFLCLQVSYHVLDHVPDLLLTAEIAGPSGHGKTELGRQMGELIYLDMIVTDMTQMRFDTDLFGPKAPYVAHKRGSMLNNFLADHSGKRAVVMLDEIDRAGPKLVDSLLIMLDECERNPVWPYVRDC